jgi:hypothetical protein
MKQLIVLLAPWFLLATVQGRDLQQSDAPTACPPNCENNTLAEVLAMTPSLSTFSAAVEVSVHVDDAVDVCAGLQLLKLCYGCSRCWLQQISGHDGGTTGVLLH